MKPELTIEALPSWIQTNGKPLVIAGPCSAETEDQLVNTAHELKALGVVHALRAGVWKPRTRPGSFEGMGKAALPWLQRAKAETGLPIAIEVATPEHVELALSYGVDILWLGARTTVNPFSVQEVANALRGVDVPVLIKNPVNPDLALWIGAFERMAGAGITKLAAIHRGFSMGEANKYRNMPMWQIAIELRRVFPNLPVIGDPSHMAGKRAYLTELARTAMDLNYNGLIIESHVEPDKAWSDAAQQLTPVALGKLLDQLWVWNAESVSTKYSTFREGLQQKIDVMDQQLIDVLEVRRTLAEELTNFDQKNEIALCHRHAITQTRLELYERLNLDLKSIGNLYKRTVIKSLNMQLDVMDTCEVIN